MAYTDDAVLAKLSALNETQESIVTVAQWVMFHRRHADRTGQLWLQRLKDSGSNKRLNLIYLANEVAQQSKARKKNDFLIAFSPVIAEAAATAYKGATNEVQQKLRRVVEVWRERHVFEIPIQDAIESRIDELDKNKSTGGKGGGLLGSSLFSKGAGSVPAELAGLVAPQQTISKLVLSTKTSLNAANQDYDRLTDPNVAPPSAPVHAARLNGLLKTLANAEGAVAESIKARKLLIEGLEKILSTNRAALVDEEAKLAELSSRRITIDVKKRDVEDSIMRGFAPTSDRSQTPDGEPAGSHSPTMKDEPDRPEIEALTPPTQSPREPSFEPEGPAIPEYENATIAAAIAVPSVDAILEQLRSNDAAMPSVAAPLKQTTGSDLMASLSGPYGSGSNGTGSVKKRKLNDDANDFPDLGGDAMDDIDDDVAEILRAGSGS